MGIPLREIIKQLPLEEQKEIEKRSAELLAEEKSKVYLMRMVKTDEPVLFLP